MDQIIEFVTLNYTWIIGITILILLAIIGYYADKSNFGTGNVENKIQSPNQDQVNKQEQNINKAEDLSYLNYQDIAKTNLKPETKVENDKKEKKIETVAKDNVDSKEFVLNSVDKPEGVNDPTASLDSKLESTENIDILTEMTIKNDTFVRKSDIDPGNVEWLDDSVSKCDEEFDSLIPQKDVISNDLLDEIENLSFDKKLNLESNDLPDLDNIQLPKIKKNKMKDIDIWKF